MAIGCLLPSATCKQLLLLHHLLLILLLITGPQPAICVRKPWRSAHVAKDLQNCSTESRGPWWNWLVSLMPELSGPQFTRVAEPLLQMCTNAYKFQYNVPPHKQQHLIPIKGWSLSLKVPPAAPLRQGLGGVHALVYEEDPEPFAFGPPRAVIAFRGWQTSSTSLDELADLCAGKLLLPNYMDFLSPPSHLCSSLFNESTLNYLSQAVAYTRLVLQSYPALSLLLSGHSFGGGLAVLVSAALQQDPHGCGSSSLEGFPNSHQHSKRLTCSPLPVVSFSGPGTHQDMRNWGWTLKDSCHIITISHEWDFFSVRARWKDHLGWLCSYEKQEPASCKLCFSDELRSASLEVLKPRASLDGVLKGKDKNGSLHSIKGNDDEDGNDNDKVDDDDGTDVDHDILGCSDDCEDDEPCWDCLSDSHAPESLLAVMEENLKPTCLFLAQKAKRSPPRHNSSHMKSHESIGL